MSRETLEQSMSFALDRIWDDWPSALVDQPAKKPVKPESIIETMKKWFSIRQNDKWLIIYDDVHHPPTPYYNIGNYLPKADHGAIIITTRLKQYTRLGKPYELKKMTKAQSSRLLDSALERPLPLEENNNPYADSLEDNSQGKF
jgi:hypothetical protein